MARRISRRRPRTVDGSAGQRPQVVERAEVEGSAIATAGAPPANPGEDQVLLTKPIGSSASSSALAWSSARVAAKAGRTAGPGPGQMFPVERFHLHQRGPEAQPLGGLHGERRVSRSAGRANSSTRMSPSRRQGRTPGCPPSISAPCSPAAPAPPVQSAPVAGRTAARQLPGAAVADSRAGPGWIWLPAPALEVVVGQRSAGLVVHQPVGDVPVAAGHPGQVLGPRMMVGLMNTSRLVFFSRSTWS